MLCDCVFHLHARNRNRKSFLPLVTNMLLVSINVSMENISVKFPAFVNFIMLCNFRA